MQQNLFDKERTWTNLTTEARGKVAGFVDFDWGAALCPGGPAECGADTRVGVREVWTVWAISALQHAALAVLECAAPTPGWLWGCVDSVRCILSSTSLPCLDACLLHLLYCAYHVYCADQTCVNAVDALHPGFGATLPPPPPCPTR